MAESDLDRLAFGLGGKVMTNLILSNVQQLLVSADWKHRYTRGQTGSTGIIPGGSRQWGGGGQKSGSVSLIVW